MLKLIFILIAFSSSGSSSKLPRVTVFIQTETGALEPVDSFEEGNEALVDDSVIVPEGSNLLLHCESEFPVQWLYVGNGIPKMSTNMSESIVNKISVVYNAYSVISSTKERNSGHYRCVCTARAHLIRSKYVFIPGDSLFLPTKGYRIQYSGKDDTVVIPCTVTHPLLKVSLMRISDNGQIPMDESIAPYNPKIGFTLHANESDFIEGDYVCTATNGDAFRVLEYSLQLLNEGNESSALTCSSTEQCPMTYVCLSTNICSRSCDTSECVNGHSCLMKEEKAECVKTLMSTSTPTSPTGVPHAAILFPSSFNASKKKGPSNDSMSTNNVTNPIQNHCKSYRCPQRQECKLLSNGAPYCVCEKGYLGDDCVPWCDGDFDCAKYQKCKNKGPVSTCVHRCEEQNCNLNEECNPDEETGLPKCTCRKGYEKNSTDGCIPTTLDSRPDTYCRAPKCGPYATCFVNKCQCIATARGTWPNCEQGCFHDRDCEQLDHKCSSDGRCVRICVEDSCGKEALCRTQNRQPMCLCPAGFAGDPTVQCYKKFIT